jgi:hypothetical protein
VHTNKINLHVQKERERKSSNGAETLKNHSKIKINSLKMASVYIKGVFIQGI